MFKLFLSSLAVAGTLFLSGCGEDSATELRVNLVTMINATQNNIASKMADMGTEDIVRHASRGENLVVVGEAPEVSYNGSHKKTISKDDSFSAYIATGCHADGFLYHTSSLGDLRIVNTSSKSITARVLSQSTTKDITVASCSMEKTGVGIINSNVDIIIDGVTHTINPNGETVWDSVVFEDDTFKNFAIKSIQI